MDSKRMQSWVEEHKLPTIGGVWAAALGASVAYNRRRAPQRATSLRLIHARIHAQALTLAILGGVAAFMHYRSKANKNAADQLDLDFYSQLPPATDAAAPAPRCGSMGREIRDVGRARGRERRGVGGRAVVLDGNGGRMVQRGAPEQAATVAGRRREMV